jgi:peptide/nickel transport system ATP-binding protein
MEFSISNLRVETDAGVTIVDDVSFDVLPSRAVGIVGESGSGKTTVAVSLLGYARPGTRITSGSVRLGKDDLLALNGDRLRALRGASVAYVPQSPGRSLNPSMRVGRQLAEVIGVHKSGSTDSVAIGELLERVGLPGNRALQRRYPHQLSGGQQQRLALAIALSCRSRVLVLDEPTTGLDVVTQQRVLGEIDKLRRTEDIMVVLVSHDLAVVSSLVDDLAVMYAGNIVEFGRAADVLADPAHPYTVGLVGSVPDPAGRHTLYGIPGAAAKLTDRGPGCPFAPRCAARTDLCDQVMPEPVEVAPGRTVRCHHPSTISLHIGTEVISQPRRQELQPLLSVDGLSATYGQRGHEVAAVRDVSFAIAPGECLALVGESGSGKSTIARCIAGLHAPAAGELRFLGEPLAPSVQDRSAESRRRIQIVFQDPYDTLNPSQTVGQAIGRPLRLFGLASRATVRAQVAELLGRVRLSPEVAGRRPGALSGGERQRVAIARALAAGPDLLICDEITSALDVSVQAAVLNLLGTLRQELGLSMLFISHDLGVVASIADEALVLSSGVAVEHGAVEDVLQRPQDAYTRELVAAAHSPVERGVERAS